MFPAANVKIANNGTFVLAPDDKVTPSVKVTLTAFDGMEEDKTYIVPLTVTSSTEGVTFTETSKHMVLLVQDYRNKPNTNKGEDAVQTLHRNSYSELYYLFSYVSQYQKRVFHPAKQQSDYSSNAL